jgi:RHS repeat-associated protein
MSHHATRRTRRALAVAIHLACAAGAAQAADENEPKPFPAYRDGHYVPKALETPGASGHVHHASSALQSDVGATVAAYCKGQSNLSSCRLETSSERDVAGLDGKESAYPVLDIVVDVVTDKNEHKQILIKHGVVLAQSCPSDSEMYDDGGAVHENRDPESGRLPMACLSPAPLPKAASLGQPRESGANQCAIGNAPTVGNPINPLTMTKLEFAEDYTGPASSGLVFGRSYHSGAFSLVVEKGRVAARYPEGSHMGARWRHTYDRYFVQRPYYDDEGRIYTTALHLVREDGNETRFVRKGGTFVPAEGERGSLREDPDGGWVYALADGTIEHFDDRGRFRSRTDTQGNVLTLHYGEITVGVGLKDTVLERVTDRQGRELRLGYDRQGRLETVDTPDGRLRYAYNGGLLDGLDVDLVGVSFPDGRSVAYVYDEPALGGSPNHKLTGIVGGDGKRFATFEYDDYNRAIRSSHGNDTDVTELDVWNGSVDIDRPDRDIETWVPSYVRGVVQLGQRKTRYGGTRTFDYLGGGLVSSGTDYLDVPTEYRYDTQRYLEIERVEAKGTPVARTVKTTWHPTLAKPARIDNGAQWTTFEYDAKGNLTEQREGGLADAANATAAPWPDERVTRYTHDGAGRVLTVDGPLAGDADTTRFTYHASDAPGCTSDACAWRAGDLHTATDPLGHAHTVLAYDRSGRVLADTDANGVRTDRRYDAMGRPLERAIRARRDGVPSEADILTRATYTANGDVDTLTDADGGTVTHAYDAAHHLVRQTDSLGNQRRIEPDGQGAISKETYARNDGTEDDEREYFYDGRGLLERIETKDKMFDFELDANGRLIKRSGFAATTPRMHRDALGRVDSLTQQVGSATTRTELHYDGTDRVATVVDPNGLSTAYLRNGLGDLLWQRSPDTGDTTFDNDATGQPISERPADARHRDRAYDTTGRLTRETYHDGTQTVWVYDTADPSCAPDETFAVGRLSTVTDRSGSTALCYDFAGRIVRKTQATQGITLALQYTYTKAGRLASVTYPDGRLVSYTRDAMGHVTGVDTRMPAAATQSIATDMHHDALGRLTGWTAGARALTRTYSGVGAITSVRDMQPGGLDISVKYGNDHVSGIKSPLADGYMFADEASHVTGGTALFLPPNSAQSNAHTYTYDSTGNRLTWDSGSTVKRRFTYAPDSHHLLMADTVLREYDAAGNTTRIGEREFEYDAAGRMSQVKVNGIVEMHYAYSALGQQVARFIAGQTTVALHDEAGHWIGDYDASGRPIRQFVWLDDMPLAAIDGDAIRDIQTDQIGAPRVVIDRATNKAIWAWSIHREAFGTEAPDDDPDKDGTKYVLDMRFPGQRYDAATGLFQNGWRDYDPTSGRYIQSDPIGLAGGISTYAYAGSNPYSRIDPSGLDIVVLVDPRPNPWGTQSFGGFGGHAAGLIGNDDGVTGWDYYSKDGDGEYVHQRYDTLLDVAQAFPGRYTEGTLITRTHQQDNDAREWAGKNFDTDYSGVRNNCADLVYGTLEAGGVPIKRSMISLPREIVGNIDGSRGAVVTRPLTFEWFPAKYKHPKFRSSWGR